MFADGALPTMNRSCLSNIFEVRGTAISGSFTPFSAFLLVFHESFIGLTKLAAGLAQNQAPSRPIVPAVSSGNVCHSI